MNCPRCGARNPRDAAWCTQCFASFRAAPDADGSDRAGQVESGETIGAAEPTGSGGPGAAGDVTVDDPGSASVRSARSGDVRVTGELVEWRCRRCDGWNVLELAGCVTCGAPREGFGASTPSPARAPVDITTARLASVLLPGLGHLLLGALGTGVARALLFVLWIVGGLALLGDATTGGLVLILGAVVLWGVTLVDVQRLSAGRRELLGARGLGALVAVVTVLLVLGAALRVVGA